MVGTLIIIYLIGSLLVTFAAYAAGSAWPILKHPRTIHCWSAWSQVQFGRC